MDAKDVMQRALGYYELGLFEEADELLASSVPDSPTVEFEHLRILVKIDQSKWEAAEELAAGAIEHYPERSFGYIQRAYALHEMKRTREAADILEKAPIDPIDSVEDILAYNKACYNAQLGQETRALDALREAIRHNASLWADACEDPDFEPIRHQLVGLKP